jgi:hypothetical protein
LQELLLNFGVSKRELCKFVHMSVHKLNKVLEDPSQVGIISNEQARRIKNFYYSMIQHAPAESLTMSYLELIHPPKRKAMRVAEDFPEEKEQSDQGNLEQKNDAPDAEEDNEE